MISFMTPFTKRNLLIPVAAVLFMGVLYVLDRTVPILGSHVQHLELIIISLMIMMSIVIMLFWSLLGVCAGLAYFFVSMIFLYRPLTDLNPYYYSVLILAFILSSYIGYRASRKIQLSGQDYTVTMEKVQGDINLVSDHKKNREAEFSAMGEKISSLLKLKGIADSLSLSLSEGDIIKIVSKETFNIFRENGRVMFFMMDEPRRALSLFHTSKGEGRKAFLPENGGIFGRGALKNMKSLLVKDVRKDFRFSIDEETMKDDATSLIIKPLVVESKVLGLLRADSTRGSAFAQHDLRILDIIGELAAVALENARLYRRTEELAIRDSLTGLYVRRYFMERLEEEVKRALRSNGSFAMFMLDIDNFKDFNDKYGHISGDAILKNIGRVLKRKASAGDIVARYGGEEFAFLALNCGREEGARLAEEIRDEIQKSPVVLRREKCSVTVSVGVAVFPEDARLGGDIIWEADRRLYAAKAKGKNAVCSG